MEPIIEHEKHYTFSRDSSGPYESPTKSIGIVLSKKPYCPYRISSRHKYLGQKIFSFQKHGEASFHVHEVWFIRVWFIRFFQLKTGFPEKIRVSSTGSGRLKGFRK